MIKMKVNRWKWIGIGSILVIAAMLITVLVTPPLRSAITQISGLAVAQSAIQWNNVKDAAVGDAQTNGLMAVHPYFYDPVGATSNRLRGTAGGFLSISLPSTGVLTLLNAVAAPTIGATNNITTTFPTDMTWEIVVTGAPANQTTNLEGSIDGTNFYILDTSIITTSEMRHVALKPVLYVRGNCTVLPGGTVTVRFVGKGN
jgi:hypothetical protein